MSIFSSFAAEPHLSKEECRPTRLDYGYLEGRFPAMLVEEVMACKDDPKMPMSDTDASHRPVASVRSDKWLDRVLHRAAGQRRVSKERALIIARILMFPPIAAVKVVSRLCVELCATKPAPT